MNSLGFLFFMSALCLIIGTVAYRRSVSGTQERIPADQYTDRTETEDSTELNLHRGAFITAGALLVMALLVVFKMHT
jgi:hypothetical protein